MLTFVDKPRLKAAGLHLLLSLSVAVLVALLVLRLWFPAPFDELAGGRHLFFLVVSVDVVLGPLLTLAVFDIRKAVTTLRLDIGVIALMQLLALAYGMHTCFVARPVALVFEKDRFRMVTAAEVRELDLPGALPAYRRLPWTGPVMVSTRAATPEERGEAILLAAEGFDLAQRPLYWLPYEMGVPAMLARSRPAEAVLRQCPAQRDVIQRTAMALGMAATDLRFVPLMAREQDWAVIVDPAGQVSGFIPCDVFSVPQAASRG